jgi:hypothetical protein
MKKVLLTLLVLVVGFAPVVAMAAGGGAGAGSGAGAGAAGPSDGGSTSQPGSSAPSASPTLDGSRFTTERDCMGAGGKWDSAASRCSMSR